NGPLDFYIDAVQVEDYGTGSNLITNPSFETNLNGWDTDNTNLACWINAGATLSRDNTTHAMGSYSMKVSAPGAYYGARYVMSGTAGHTYTFSAYLKSDGTNYLQLGLTTDNICGGAAAYSAS